MTNASVYLQVAIGAASGSQTLEAYNIGDGSLSLSVAASPSITWLIASVGSFHACPDYLSSTNCIPIQFSLNTAGLPQGTYTAEVAVSDPHAVDAPQVVTVTVQVGPAAAIVVDRWLAPGASSDFPFGFGSCFGSNCGATASATTQDGGQWLSVSVSLAGTLYKTYSFDLHFAPPGNMAPGTYMGKVATSTGLTVPVSMRLTTQPIAAPSSDQIRVRLAERGPAMTYPFLPYISLSNSGMGALTVSSVAAAGPGLSAYNYAGLAIVTIDPSSLAPRIYNDGMVTIQCDAANCPIQVPVSLEIVPRSPPVIRYQGVLNNATFQSGEEVAAGDVVVVKGEQFSVSQPAFAADVPLPTNLGGSRVLVDGTPAPLFYSSFGQIAFQMPTALTSTTHLLQVEREGQVGNTVSVAVVERAPKIVKITDTSYDLRDLDHPAKAGETLIIWAIGLGPTNPYVPDGAGAPSSPPAVATVTPTVHLNSRSVTPSFAGLSPGSVGLYQVIATLPTDAPKGIVHVSLSLPGLNSNGIQIAVQ